MIQEAIVLGIINEAKKCSVAKEMLKKYKSPLWKFDREKGVHVPGKKMQGKEK